jgi:hypothetical protein
MNIPSNASLKEIILYGNLPMDITLILEQVNCRLEELETELSRVSKHEEVRDEQLSFCRQYIRSIEKATKETSTHKSLKEFICMELENSFIEL